MKIPTIVEIAAATEAIQCMWAAHGYRRPLREDIAERLAWAATLAVVVSRADGEQAKQGDLTGK